MRHPNRAGQDFATESQFNITRRHFIKRLSSIVGGSSAIALAGTSQVALAYSPRKDSASQAGKVLSKAQMKTLSGVCAAVLPRTDTPSAADLDCHGFIDHQLAACYEASEHQAVRASLDAIDAYAQKHSQRAFHTLVNAERQAILRKIEKRNGFSEVQKAQFTFVKELLLFGYFTSEVGATEALAYQAVPGGYKGSTPVTEDTKAWGSMNYY
ncbi:gluconate 2-dehydrogenase subunit 3 family protein [Alteromonas oceanisediminis]|uniref:gluconate 2-dehydrogenase subunit 3 family protein n=1 Tax=Alteromonas oceanisediminis TaxID=2836180 RepID=UPI001BDA4D6D|nr:gluconate 2-dehydrogenase subunit 3 family protein [Alteromonas oceanisediminis]MBT0584983.1 gluconate 2-dehydrogenase subunit 3 family protein [Alteromonas oceanisediminis]